MFYLTLRKRKLSPVRRGAFAKAARKEGKKEMERGLILFDRINWSQDVAI
jgi:hypothetical protein